MINNLIAYQSASYIRDLTVMEVVIEKLHCTETDRNAIILMKFMSITALKVVISTALNAASDEKFDENDISTQVSIFCHNFCDIVDRVCTVMLTGMSSASF